MKKVLGQILVVAIAMLFSAGAYADTGDAPQILGDEAMAYFIEDEVSGKDIIAIISNITVLDSDVFETLDATSPVIKIVGSEVEISVEALCDIGVSDMIVSCIAMFDEDIFESGEVVEIFAGKKVRVDFENSTRISLPHYVSRTFNLDDIEVASCSILQGWALCRLDPDREGCGLSDDGKTNEGSTFNAPLYYEDGTVDFESVSTTTADSQTTTNTEDEGDGGAGCSFIGSKSGSSFGPIIMMIVLVGAFLLKIRKERF